MLTVENKQEYYQALLDKNSEYEGIFYVGIKTTGIFCRPTCSARKPKFENCEFFESLQQALLASFRPCKRCQPLAYPNQVTSIIQTLIKLVEENPEKRWKEDDLKKLSIDGSTARRQFKKRFGMTFVEYARAQRMGLAMKKIRAGEAVIGAQLAMGYESSSGFRDAFSRIMGAAPTLLPHNKVLKAAWLDTPLGPMLAVADDIKLYLLEFIDRKGLEREVERLRQKTKSTIIPGHTSPIHTIEQELNSYFKGELKTFKTPLHLLGSPFQKYVWEQLQKIPYGKTQSYTSIANMIGNPVAHRAVAKANGSNQLAIIIPCHRVINLNGNLCGYAGGLARKKWLLEHEARHVLK